MTNAEKLAKDTDFLSDVLANLDCIERECSGCHLAGFHGLCFDKERVKEWLESEVEEDD